MTKVARLYEEEKEQAVEQTQEQERRLVVTTMIEAGLDENQIVRLHPLVSLDYVRKIAEEMKNQEELLINKGGTIKMSTLTANTVEIMNVLPIEDQELLYSMAKKLIRAWDPDFTKLTPPEAEELKAIIDEVNNGEYVSEDDIDWE